MRAGTAVVIVVSAVALLGCGSPEWTATVTDSAGVTIVANPAEGVWTASDRWRVEEDRRIGGTDGDPNYLFGRIGGVAVDSRGRILALDMMAQHVQVFSADGAYELTVGAPGQGPGELEQAEGLAIGPGDTIFVHGRWAPRVELFTADGSPAGGFRLQRQSGFPIWYHGTSAGVIAVQLRPATAGRVSAPDPMDGIVILSTEGLMSDTLMTFASGQMFRPGTPAEIRIYYPEPAWTLTDDLDLLFAITDQYRIMRYHRGELQRIITKPFDPKVVSDGDKAPIEAYLEDIWINAGANADVIRQMRQRLQFADVFPAFWFEGLVAGPWGTTWVQQVQHPSELTEEEAKYWDPFDDVGAPDWDVFDRDGRFLGVVAMPRRFAPRVFRDDHIYGVFRDELDVQYLLRLRVVRPDAS